MKKHHKIVHAMGRKIRIQGNTRVRGRRYDIVETLTSNAARPRLLLLDRNAGSDAFRVLLTLPRNSNAANLIAVLRELPKFGDLPRIIDVEQSRDQIRLVLDYVSGRPLSDYLSAIKCGCVVRPSPYEVARLVHQLAGGLWNLHERANLVHGDIKPANLIITRKATRICLIDFGNAFRIEQMASRPGGDGVTPGYAPPELQEKRIRADGRIDQFSASVLFYELLTLRLPYDGLGGLAGSTANFAAFRNFQHSLASGHEAYDLLPSSLRDKLTQVVARGLQLNIEDRFPDTHQWRTALGELRNSLDSQRNSWKQLNHLRPTVWSIFARFLLRQRQSP